LRGGHVAPLTSVASREEDGVRCGRRVSDDVVGQPYGVGSRDEGGFVDLEHGALLRVLVVPTP
jgi:hypothetical protein